jgi:hypothetical protein
MRSASLSAHIKGLHRIRHYGLFANGKNRAANIGRARQLLAVPQSAAQHT